MKCSFGWILLLLTFSIHAQPIAISTFAGYAGRGGNDGVGANARFHHPHGLAIDSAGNIYVADTDNHTIRKITPQRLVSTVAGLAGVSGSSNGTNNARFFKPQGVTVDAANNIYVADTGNHTIRKITTSGNVSTVAGRAGESGSDDGFSGEARFHQPTDVALDSLGNIYVADFGNGRIRQISPDAIVSTLSFLPGPQGIAVDQTDEVYIADFGSSAIWNRTSEGFLGILAGSAHVHGSNDATGTNALFYHPAAVALDNAGNAYVADYFNSTIRKITATGAVNTVAGIPGMIGYNDGAGTGALFHRPQGIVVDSAFNVYVADTGNSVIRKITPGGAVMTFAGSASANLQNESRGSARFSSPVGIAVDNTGSLFVADAANQSVRKISSTGAVTTFAGFAAELSAPMGIAVDGAGNLFVADTGNATIRKITSTGTITTLAGSTGNHGYVDGTGTAAEFYQPQGITLDNSGNVIVADTLNHVIRKISSGGVVMTIAGMGENFGGADGVNGKARFHRPVGLTVGNDDAIYVADSLNHTIRKITPNGTNHFVTTVAGWAGLSGDADGTNNEARFFQPRGIALDGAGNLYVVDSGNHAIRKIAPVGTNWVVSTVAGWSGVSGSADGPGGNARFQNPSGIAIDGAGFLYVTDSANNTIRVNRIVPPELHFTFSQSRLVLSWSALASGFILETASNLSPPVSWMAADGWTLLGDNYVLTNSVNGGTAFFRLRQP